MLLVEEIDYFVRIERRDLVSMLPAGREDDAAKVNRRESVVFYGSYLVQCASITIDVNLEQLLDGRFSREVLSNDGIGDLLHELHILQTFLPTLKN